MADTAPTPKPRRQIAALPVRQHDGVTEVLLITSRETGRWILPKGWLKKGMAPHAAAAREAFEEAGLIGRASRQAVGSYRYLKRLSETETVICKVDVFVIDVERQAEDWPEKTQRRQRWLTPQNAALLVAESGLAVLLRRLAAVADKPKKLSATLRARAKTARGKPGRLGSKAETRPASHDNGSPRRRRAAEPAD